MSIGVYIENGGINTLNVSNSVIDQLAAIDQAESHFRSENIKFGMSQLSTGRSSNLCNG